MNETQGRLELARRVVADRSRIFRTVEKAKTKAEISRGAWEKVEAGKPVRPYTLTAVEQALGWPPGEAQRLIESGAPTQETPAESDALAELRAEVAHLREEVEHLKGQTG